MKKKIAKKAKSFLKHSNSRVFILFSVLFLAVFFFFITLPNVHMETYNIERFTNARDTIRSPVTIENEQATERQTRETVQAVEDRYNISEEITGERVEYVMEIFDAISMLEEESLRPEGDGENQRPVPVSNREKVRQLKEILSTEITDAVNDSLFIQLVEIPEDEREEGQELFISLLEETMEAGVRTENIQSAISTMKQSINYSELSPEMKNELARLTDFAVVENSFFDMEKTMEARRNAASSVDPVVIRAGEVIVREGQTITNEIYEDLTLVGALDNDRNLYPLIGLGILLLIISFIAAHEMYWLSKKQKIDRRKVIAILIISILVASLMKIASLYTTEGNNLFFAVPVATGVLLIKQLIHERTAIVFSVLYAILGSIIFNGQIPGSLNVEAGIYFLLAQLAGIIFLMNVKDRLSILRSGIGMTIINVLTVLLFLFLSIEKYAMLDILIQASFGLASAFLSAVLMIGLLPFFETGLGILSDIKLLQLASPNQPLLKKLLTEAPGTYHHSIMVANLSETACEAIGANGLLARVGAYYHDLGKTVRPHYFIENQLSINNPHDVISPKQSAEIIISHPYDGAEMLKKHRLPEEIIDIAKQHHGTTLLKYFYYKEKESNKHVKEENYRYPGPKPQTKEAAIVCICDSVEAAVRSLKEPTEEKIEEIVSSIVKDRMTDGQLNETPLTLHELDVVHRTVCDALKGIFHSRIQYPIKEAK
ncbi:HDIG domain-containing metalloprotein [Virgibacillus sp. YIM 98842]|uniref:HD family phosphohydrolase n=1 Tax=Virgibacillus sp. YIM 98842 TaxID=2663533 RepID=UPI0013DB3035|nr:HDIG domain-containing metalloprotein [Virgibacillus sp. YIM 98842]